MLLHLIGKHFGAHISWWQSQCPALLLLSTSLLGRLDPPLLRDLFTKIVEESRLAGELGVRSVGKMASPQSCVGPANNS